MIKGTNALVLGVTVFRGGRFLSLFFFFTYSHSLVGSLPTDRIDSMCGVQIRVTIIVHWTGDKTNMENANRNNTNSRVNYHSAEHIHCDRHCGWYGDVLTRCMSCHAKYLEAKHYGFKVLPAYEVDEVVEAASDLAHILKQVYRDETSMWYKSPALSAKLKRYYEAIWCKEC